MEKHLPNCKIGEISLDCVDLVTLHNAQRHKNQEAKRETTRNTVAFFVIRLENTLVHRRSMILLSVRALYITNRSRTPEQWIPLYIYTINLSNKLQENYRRVNLRRTPPTGVHLNRVHK